jgi:hypothetical protein
MIPGAPLGHYEIRSSLGTDVTPNICSILEVGEEDGRFADLMRRIVGLPPG